MNVFLKPVLASHWLHVGRQDGLLQSFRLMRSSTDRSLGEHIEQLSNSVYQDKSSESGAFCTWLHYISQKRAISLLPEVFGKHKVQRHQLGVTSCCWCPSEEDTSARGCRAAPAARRGSRPRWARLRRNRCTTPTRRARDGEEPCGRWTAGPGPTGGKPQDREAPGSLRRRRRRKTKMRWLKKKNFYCSFCFEKNELLPSLTWQNEADWRRLEEEHDFFAEGHGDAYGPHHHEEEAEHGQHGRRHV